MSSAARTQVGARSFEEAPHALNRVAGCLLEVSDAEAAFVERPQLGAQRFGDLPVESLVARDCRCFDLAAAVSAVSLAARLKFLVRFVSARTRGVIANSVGDGRLATAPRSDFSEATAVVLTTPGHEGKAYELSGDTAWDYDEFADAAAEVLGTPVTYQALTPEQEHEMLSGAGLDDATVGFIGAMNAGMRDDTQAPTTGDLARLIGRPTTPLADTLATWK